MKTIQLILLFFASQLFAQQSIDSIINLKTLDLQLNGINHFFYFETYCNGGIKMLKLNEKDCSVENSNIYVFWRNNDKDFLQKVSNCTNPVIEISNKIIDFYSSNINTFVKENVERYKTSQDSIVANKKYSFVKMTVHSCFINFHFYINSVFMEKKFDEFDLTNEKKDPNINYKLNKKLKLVELAKMCEKIIKNTHLK